MIVCGSREFLNHFESFRKKTLKSPLPNKIGIMGLILYQKITGKRRKRSLLEDGIDPWELLENLDTIALHGNQK